jgi:hypothetical protein
MAGYGTISGQHQPFLKFTNEPYIKLKSSSPDKFSDLFSAICRKEDLFLQAKKPQPLRMD